MIRFALLITLFFSVAGQGLAATLKLADGSTIRGEVVSLKNGVYSVRSDSLGRISVPAKDVTSISYSDTNRPNPSGNQPDNQTQIRQLQTGLAADSTTMSMISELQNDPQLQAILADPEIMRAVAAGDLATLMANEKFMAIMNHAKIREITRQVSGGN